MIGAGHYLLEISSDSAILLLRRRLSVGGGKPGQFSTFSPEIPCETTGPGRLRWIPLQEQFDKFFNNQYFY